jgi:alkaline phosphatase D
MNRILSFWVLTLSLGTQAVPWNLNQALSRFAFGGCNNQFSNQNYWSVIGEKSPDLWVWNGDIIYADFLVPAMRRRQYSRLKSSPSYRAFDLIVPIIGIWDDHDYASNNAGKNAAWKRESQEMLLDFLEEPATSPRRQQEGIYTSYLAGPVGKQIHFILLDGRTFRDAPGAESDMLGDAQWKWLEDEILGDKSDLLILVSGTVVLPFDAGGEMWASYPKSRNRLLNLLAEAKSPTLILSGDKHYSEISKITLPNGKDIIDFTSSGLTHSTPFTSLPNRYRVSKLFREKNFGLVDIDWEEESPSVNMQIYSTEGELFDSYQVSFSH